MKLLDVLAKFGILRFGTKVGKYRTGLDRPDEFLMDDITNAKRDLTTQEDIREVKQALAKRLKGRHRPD